MNLRPFVLATLVLAAIAPLAQAGPDVKSPTPLDAPETPAAKDARLAWWRAARFGMFIHWGVYSVPAGIWQGKEIGGIGEWIMHKAKIPMADYHEFAKEFNPVDFDADAWVKMAREAGVRYIVFTAKHHDGFAMFPSAASKWNLADATPFKRDPVKELSVACQKYGIKFGLYYSQALDWNNGGSTRETPWDPQQKVEMDKYIDTVAIPQLKEILTRYGPIAELWWDVPADMNPERATRLYKVAKELQPGIIMNNRLGGGYRGDTETPEQRIPATGFKDRDFEVCMTMNGTWGYKSFDQNWKSAPDLIRKLVDISSKGGNFLLNVGPDSKGVIPPPSVERMKAIGAWLDVNGEAIYGTTASPFAKLPWGRATKKTDAATGKTALYLFVFNWPADGRLVVPGLESTVSGAHLLASGAAVPAAAAKDGVQLTVPHTAPDQVATVIKLDIAEPLRVHDETPTQTPDGALALTADQADINSAFGSHTTVTYEQGISTISDWKHPKTTLSWTANLTRPGSYAVTAEIAASSASNMTLQAGSAKAKAELPATGGDETFQSVPLGTIAIDQTGATVITLTPDATAWKPIRLRALHFAPAAK